MKVQFRKNIRSYSGKNEDMVYLSYKNGWVCIGRDFVYPKLNENHTLMGKVGSNLANVYRHVSPAYQQDLKIYAERYDEQHVSPKEIAPKAYFLFVKMMHAWRKSDPEHVDLTTMTVADIVAADADVITIYRAIENDFLRRVTLYQDLTSNIQ